MSLQVCARVSIAFVAVAGCASVPTAPAGPLQPQGSVQLSEAQILDLTIGDMPTESGSEGGIHGGGGTMIPARVGARVALADWMDVAADWGWSGIGGEVRFGAPADTRLPFAVALSARSAALAPIVFDVDEIRTQRDYRARFELYPLLSALEGGRAALNGIVAAGYSRGVQNDGPLLLDEDRVEGALGVEMRARRAFLSLIAMPYYVVQSSNPRVVSCGIAHCIQPDDATLLTYSPGLGLSLTFTLGLVLGGRD